MSISTSQMDDTWIGLTGWPASEATPYPTDQHTPTRMQLHAWYAEAEQEALRKITVGNIINTTITTTADVAYATGLSNVIAGRKIHSVILNRGDGATGKPLDFVDYNLLIREHPNWAVDQTTEPGEPRVYSIGPSNAGGGLTIWFYPTPEQEYDIIVQHALVFQQMAMPGSVVYFLVSQAADGTTIYRVNGDFENDFIDIPRAIWAQGDGTAGLQSATITISGKGYGGGVVTDTLTLDATDSSEIITGTTLFQYVDSITVPDVTGSVVNVGISETFSTGSPSYQQARTSSCLIDEFARRIGPYYAAAMYFERKGDFIAADRLFRRHRDNEQEFIKAMSFPSMSKPRPFGAPQRRPYSRIL